MQLTQTVSMAFKAISGNKVRAFLTMLGVIIGVMSVIVLIAMGIGIADMRRRTPEEPSRG